MLGVEGVLMMMIHAQKLVAFQEFAIFFARAATPQGLVP
jgi:hypothetical protein